MKKYSIALSTLFLIGSIFAAEPAKKNDVKDTKAEKKTEQTASQKHIGYPTSTNKYINDFANVIEAADADRTKNTLESLETQTGIQLCVVTINSMNDYQGTENSIEKFATNLFNTWGIGKKDKNNGVLLLVAVKDHKVRITLGSGYPSDYNGRMATVIKNDLVPFFKHDQYSRGIYEGSVAIVKAITKEETWFEHYKWDILVWIIIFIIVMVAISCFRSGKKGWGWGLLALGGGLLLLLWSMSSGDNKSDGFGGGKSDGGGAGGEW